jgi:hypothetical protein
VVVVPGATVVVVEVDGVLVVVAGRVVEVDVDVGTVVVLFGIVVVDVVVVVGTVVEVVVLVVVVEAATVVVVVVGTGTGMTVMVIAEEPVTDKRLACMTPAVVIDDEPVTTIGVLGESIPEFTKTNFEEPSTVRSAMFPGTKLIAGVAGVSPFNVTWEEPVTSNLPPNPLLHARVSFVAVPHAKTSLASVPDTLDELVTLNDPANQYTPGIRVTLEEPPKVTLR